MKIKDIEVFLLSDQLMRLFISRSLVILHV